MSTLKVFAAGNAELRRTETDADSIAGLLHEAGIRFERWQADRVLSDDMEQDEIIAAYGPSVQALKDEYGFASADVVALAPDHPDRAALRAKFLDEHTHGDFEVRFFVDGSGLFYIHRGDQVFGIMCEQGDLISVPADTPHWFDMGEAPRFKCIRLFTTAEGWVANYTGDDIAGRFPRYDGF